MTTAPDPLDLRARQLHADALEHLSPATLARLRAARHAATRAGAARRLPRLVPWLAGSGLAAVLAVAVLLPGRAPVSLPDAASAAVAADPAHVLQEDPGFYVWLASADALAME